MVDMSNLDKKYFIDENVHNCSYCQRNNIVYDIVKHIEFDQTFKKKCYAIFVKCSGCFKTSMHLTNSEIVILSNHAHKFIYRNNETQSDIDKLIFYHMPSSNLTINNKIPSELRDLMEEANTSIKNNLLTGASACIRKTIYKFLEKHDLKETEYKDKIKELKSKYLKIDEMYFDILGTIQGITSDQVHENSYEQYDSSHAKALLELLQELLIEIYVLPEELKNKKTNIEKLFEEVKTSSKKQKND